MAIAHKDLNDAIMFLQALQKGNEKTDLNFFAILGLRQTNITHFNKTANAAPFHTFFW